MFPIRNSRLVEAEVDLDAHHHRNRLPLFHRRLELVLPDRLERLLIQSHAQRAGHARILWIALGVNDKRDQHDALVLRAASLVAKFRFGREDWYWCRDSAT